MLHKARKSSVIDRVEEITIAFILGVMILLTFGNVVVRYVFNSNIFYALELTVFLFAWLVLLGASYGVKHTMHLGVDVLVNVAPARVRRLMALFAAGICLMYAVILLKGSWDYWAPFANLQPTEGRWVPLGFTDSVRGQGWYETQDIPVPFFMRFLEDVFNDGDPYEKLPKVIPYLVMPLSMTLLLYRFVQASMRIWRGEQEMLIVSHEAEDDVAESAQKLKDAD